MGHPSKALTGAVVSIYISGEAVGAIIQIFLGDRLGRIRLMQVLCVIVTIGTILQTASVNLGMFLAGRALAGVAVGGMVSTVPIYLRDRSSRQQRIDWRHIWLRYLLRHHDVKLDWLCMQLFPIWSSSVACASGDPDPLGHHHVYRAINVHAELTAPTHSQRKD